MCMESFYRILQQARKMSRRPGCTRPQPALDCQTRYGIGAGIKRTAKSSRLARTIVEAPCRIAYKYSGREPVSIQLLHLTTSSVFDQSHQLQSRESFRSIPPQPSYSSQPTQCNSKSSPLCWPLSLWAMYLLVP